MENIKVLDMISLTQSKRSEKYINYFFKEFAGIKKQKPIYESFTEVADMKISIIKDSTSRILDNKKGKLMERSWRNCVFYFIDKESYKSHFGTNEKYPELDINNGNIQYTGSTVEVNSKFPNAPRTHYSLINGVQSTVFNYFKENHSSWFVRSYVYFIMIICDDYSKIKSQDFHIHYWNTNYAFKKVSNKINLFNNVSGSIFVEDIKQEIQLIETSNRDVIDCVKAYTGELDFRNQTEENYEDITKDINDGINYILVEGAARTGKTIIAMRILGQYDESEFLIMNYYFYVALMDAFNILEVEFPKSRIYHHSLRHKTHGCWVRGKYAKTIVPKLEFLIVDEAQRLANVEDLINRYNGKVLPGIDEISKIINCQNQRHTILLGDNLQKLNPQYDEGFERIYNMIKDKQFREYKFKNSIGVAPEILENIKYLLSVPGGGQVQPTYNFNISVTDSENDFIYEYNLDNTFKKHYVCVGLNALSGQKIANSNTVIEEYPKDLIKAEYPYLFNKEVQDKYLLSTYQVISREIESVYLYLPEEVIYDEENDEIILNGGYGEKMNDFLLYHIYTLMTRATLTLKILCKSDSLYKYFESKIDKIKKVNLDADLESYELDFENNVAEELQEQKQSYDYDFFIAYHGTNDPKGSYEKAKNICDFLKDNGFKVFLNDYSSNMDDADLGFNETKYIIQRSNKFLLVFNENIYRDEYGMLPRKYPDKKPNQLYSELVMFSSLVDDDLRTNKHHLKFYYVGDVFKRSNIYGFLNNLYRNGTTGNSNCCFFENEELLEFASK